jgi:protein-L-isoaspartate(D-aspartate) O-methyltransferase
LRGLISILDGADPEPSSRAIISRSNLPQQFDEYVWFDETRVVAPLDTAEIKGLPDTYPFGV